MKELRVVPEKMFRRKHASFWVFTVAFASFRAKSHDAYQCFTVHETTTKCILRTPPSPIIEDSELVEERSSTVPRGFPTDKQPLSEKSVTNQLGPAKVPDRNMMPGCHEDDVGNPENPTMQSISKIAVKWGALSEN